MKSKCNFDFKFKNPLFGFEVCFFKLGPVGAAVRVGCVDGVSVGRTLGASVGLNVGKRNGVGAGGKRNGVGAGAGGALAFWALAAAARHST